MGNKWEVYAWLKMNPRYGENGYEDIQVYRGESAIKAIAVAIRWKLRGTGCVRIEWR